MCCPREESAAWMSASAVIVEKGKRVADAGHGPELGGAGRRARRRGARPVALVASRAADLVVAELEVAVVVLAAAMVADLALGTGIPSSPRWWCWSRGRRARGGRGPDAWPGGVGRARSRWLWNAPYCWTSATSPTHPARRQEVLRRQDGARPARLGGLRGLGRAPGRVRPGSGAIIIRRGASRTRTQHSSRAGHRPRRAGSGGGRSPRSDAAGGEPRADRTAARSRASQPRG